MTDTLRYYLTGLTTVLFAVDLIQSLFYLPEADRREEGEHMRHSTYFACLVAFFAAMLFALNARSLPMMWVAVELTTLFSAPLIAYHRTRGSVEAMWKYLLICSCGIGLALFGTMLFMHAQTTGNVAWYKAGFAFILAGYGTKTGLAPFHTWLPDAHSEAPAPVSALLSGTLLNCSFFAIARFRELMPDEASAFATHSMLALGIVSVLTAGVFMVRQTDFKRLLAYSSVEHMGLATILFALAAARIPSDEGECLCDGGILFIALLAHMTFHSATKTMLFLTAGNLLLAFKTRAIAAVQGLRETMPGHSMLWVFGILMICGMPPSAIFLSELALVASAPIWLSITVLALLFVVFAAMSRFALTMAMGTPTASRPEELPLRLVVMPTILCSAIAVIGAVACIATMFM